MAEGIRLDTAHYDSGKNWASQAAADVCERSWNNSPFITVDKLNEWGEFHFRDPRGFRPTDKLPFIGDIKKRLQTALASDTKLYDEIDNGTFFPRGYIQTLCADGIGTKVEMANALYEIYTLLAKEQVIENDSQLSGFRSMARNLIAMSADDIAREGGLPLVYSNVIDYSQLIEENAPAFRELMLGLGDVMSEQDLVLLNGESASLRQFVWSENPWAYFPFNWSGIMYGLYHQNLKITGEKLKAGNVIVALEQKWVRSNGLTKIRESLVIRYGKEWYKNPEALADILEAATPSVVYAKCLADANGWYSNGEKKANILSIDHISWGGLGEKFLKPTLKKRWLSATLSDLYPVWNVVSRAREALNMTLPSMANTFSIGQWALLWFENLEEAERFIALANSHNIVGKPVGEVMETSRWQESHLDITARFENGAKDEKFELSA